jgi:hypothetical protein
MVGTRLAAAKELATRDALFAAMLVTRRLETPDELLQQLGIVISGQNVEDGLGSEARDSGASDMFDGCYERGEGGPEPLEFGQEEFRPPRVVRHDADGSGFKA